MQGWGACKVLLAFPNLPSRWFAELPLTVISPMITNGPNLVDQPGVAPPGAQQSAPLTGRTMSVRCWKKGLQHCTITALSRSADLYSINNLEERCGVLTQPESGPAFARCVFTTCSMLPTANCNNNHQSAIYSARKHVGNHPTTLR